MNIYNTLSKNTEQLLLGDKVTLYVCGLTPYDEAHIGHARTYVFFDSLKRYLLKKGHSVFHVQNITDVDDKIIMRCKETGADPKQLTHENHDRALDLFNRLHILPADIYPKVTEHIEEIISLVNVLIEKGFAYETETGVYFDVSKFPNYGKLSGQNLEKLRSAVRIEVDETKRSPLDFAIWKKTKGEIIEFNSPWGSGRPGWHIECSAMALKYAGVVDIHGGAKDLIFPHHENEIAQSEGATGQPFSRYWVHTGFLTVRGEKMSKSLGNFVTLREVLSKFEPNAIRLFFLLAHYRSPLDYDEIKLKSAEEAVERIFNCLGLMHEASGSDEDLEFRRTTNNIVREFYTNLEDDFKTPEAIASLFTLIRVINSHINTGKVDGAHIKTLIKHFEEMLYILGLEQKEVSLEEDKLISLASNFDISASSANDALERLIDLRNVARNERNFQLADKIREELKSLGIILEDKKGKTIWKVQ